MRILWGDLVVGVERWPARQRGDAFELPPPFDEGRSAPLLLVNEGGEIVVDGGARRAVALRAGERVRVPLAARADAASAYRAGRDRGVEAIVELVDAPEPSRAWATGARVAIALAPVVLFASLIALAFFSPSRLRSESFSGVFEADSFTDPGGQLAPILWTLEPGLTDVRPAEPNDVACVGACGFGSQDAELAIGLRPPIGSCLAGTHTHVVQEGETLNTIAHDYGFDDYRRLYNPELNADLMKERPNPDRIYVGDVIHIPDVYGLPDVGCESVL